MSQEESKTVDWQFATYHLAEAIGEISNLLMFHSLNSDVDIESQSARLAHAYNHLNWYWNGRNRVNKNSLDFFNEEELATFSDFPTDLEVKLERR